MMSRWTFNYLLTKADALHDGAVDLVGNPYVDHLRAVALRVRWWGGSVDTVAAAVMHDTLEDTPTTSVDLLTEGMSPETVRLVEAVSRPDDMTYMEWMRRIKDYDGPEAVMIKIADVRHNMSPGRSALLDPGKAKGLAKRYALALEVLGN